MAIVQIMPMIAAAGFVAFMAVQATGAIKPKHTKTTFSFMLPALLGVLFLVWSLATVLHEGSLSFWAEHTRNLWGNQIWFDLLLAVGIGWTLILPRAKAVGMSAVPWLCFIICTGSVGFLFMVARYHYLEAQHQGSLNNRSA